MIYGIGYFFPSLGIGKNILEPAISFSIIFIGIGIIALFFSYQFAKLSEIAEELENEEKILNRD